MRFLQEPLQVDLESTKVALQARASHPYLAGFYLSYNQEYGFILCNACKIAVEPKHATLKAHFKANHPQAGCNVEKDKLALAVKDCGILPALPRIAPSKPIKPIAGLPVYHGLRCLQCPFVCGAEESLRSHIGSKHGDYSRSPAFIPCRIQRLVDAGNTGRQWFQVLPTRSTSPSPSLVNLALEEVYKELDEDIAIPHHPTTARDISPWLLSTGWHLHTGLYPAGHLRALVALPKDPEFSGLHSMVMNYIAQGMEDLKKTDLLTLQKLNTEDPAKT